jgi:hypothetical protein
MGASICLIYATTDLNEAESEVRGGLYETAKLRPLAALHARACVDNLEAALADLPEPPPFNPEYFSAAADPRYHDPPGMAIYKFESFVREAIIALRKNDTPYENLPTDGWVPLQFPAADVGP